MKFMNIIFTLIFCFFALPAHGMKNDLKDTEHQKELNKQLFEAAENNDSAGIKQLLKDGANLEATNIYGDTPLLSVAFDANKIDAFQTLLTAGADTSRKSLNQTALHVATQGDNIQAVALLIKAGANLNAKAILDQTPLHYAIEKRHSPNSSSILDMLITAGAHTQIKDKNGNNLLHTAAEHLNNKVIPVLIGQGISVNDTNIKGETPLHVATREIYLDNAPATISTLIQAGADIHALDKEGKTPLGAAVLIYNALGQSLQKPNSLKSFITAISPQDIQHVIPSFIWLKSPLRDKNVLPFPRDVGKMICNRIIPVIVNDKLALARKYLPGMFPEDVLRKEIIENTIKAINESPYIPKRIDSKTTEAHLS